MCEEHLYLVCISCIQHTKHNINNVCPFVALVLVAFSSVGMEWIADFMAPEMVTGKERQGTGMDWWALGVMLFEITLGTLPFHSELPFQSSNNEVFRSIVNAELKFPRHHNLSRSAVDFIRHLLRKVRGGVGCWRVEGRQRIDRRCCGVFFFYRLSPIPTYRTIPHQPR